MATLILCKKLLPFEKINVSNENPDAIILTDQLNSTKLKSRIEMGLFLVIYLTLIICIIHIKDLILTKLALS